MLMRNTSKPQPYAGRHAALGTMHGKEAALAPPLRQVLGLGLMVPEIDTDRFGTFTGEIPRIGTMREAAERKARAAIETTGLPLGLASEGSFGPHPAMPFVSAATEFLVFVDAERDLVVAERLFTVSTNFAHAEVADQASVTAFLERSGFPAHAVIARPNLPQQEDRIFKGLRGQKEVLNAVETCRKLSLDGKARLETDMRAHLNPTRMETLQQLAVQLAERLAVPCPACRSPGFGLIGRRRGLACRDCGHPTDISLANVYGCAACTYIEEMTATEASSLADPKWCPSCNP